MQIYLVGGAIRDQLLDIRADDKDWVVVGSSPEQMLKTGFVQVGKDFPVFLHPKTKQEYALARTERKTGSGYTGFTCYYAPNVTLEDDLLRRDLTINAMAQDHKGNIIDPYGGQRDLNLRLLRHVSSAFTDDPLRVLRVARFAAKLAHLNFRIADETLTLMQQIANSGELHHLTPERIWQEWYKSLLTPNPQVFLDVLHQCSALNIILPEIEQLFGTPQSSTWHPEIDTGLHTLMVAKQAATLSDSPHVRFASQLHDLGKAATPKNEWPHHKQHAERGIELVKNLCERVHAPNEFKELALFVCELHSHIHRITELDAGAKLNILNRLDVWRKPNRLNDVLLCCQADHAGRLGYEDTPYPQKKIVEAIFKAALSITTSQIIADGFQGKSIRDELERRRLDAITQLHFTVP